MQFKRMLADMLCAGVVAGSLICASADASAEVRYMTNFAGIPISCSIEKSQAAIAGICGNDTIEQVASVLGRPNSTSVDKYGSYIDYSYPGISIRFWNIGTDKKYRVSAMNVSTKGYYTPDGVEVGMPADVLSRIYGTADVVYTEKSAAPKLSPDQQARYERLGKTIYTYNVSAGLALQFVVRNNKITNIEMLLAD